MSNNLYTNSGQTFKTHITEEQDSSVTIDASIFIEAIYRIYADNCSTVLVEKKLSAGQIVVIVDEDAQGNPINVFQTTLLKVDMTMTAGSFTHQFKVVNAASLELPPIFQNVVTIVEVCN